MGRKYRLANGFIVISGSKESELGCNKAHVLNTEINYPQNEGGDSLFPSVILSRLDEFLEWMLSSGRSYWANDRGKG